MVKFVHANNILKHFVVFKNLHYDHKVLESEYFDEF